MFKRIIPFLFIFPWLFSACSAPSGQDGTLFFSTITAYTSSVSETALQTTTSAADRSTASVDTGDTSSATDMALDMDFLYGAWSYADTTGAWRMEFMNETDCAIGYYPADSGENRTLIGNYTLNGSVLTINGYDADGDADLSVEFTIHGYPDDCGNYLELLYQTTDHPLFALTAGDMLTVMLESTEFYLSADNYPYACMDYMLSDGDWQASLPGIANADTEALRKINTELSEHKTYINELYQEKDSGKSLECYSYLYQNDRWIQILIVETEYPGVGSTLISYNYNREQDTDVYITDMIHSLGLEEIVFLETIRQNARETLDINGAYSVAYCVADENTVNFYYIVPSPAAEEEVQTFFYTVTCDLSAKTCTAVEGLMIP